jgi:hypothetical protein
VDHRLSTVTEFVLVFFSLFRKFWDNNSKIGHYYLLTPSKLYVFTVMEIQVEFFWVVILPYLYVASQLRISPEG